MNCMTSAMGGADSTAKWLAKRQAEAFPCPYSHVIATVPSQLRDLFKRHQKIFYGILMQSAARAVCELASDRHYIGTEWGVLSIPHTWITPPFSTRPRQAMETGNSPQKPELPPQRFVQYRFFLSTTLRYAKRKTLNY